MRSRILTRQNLTTEQEQTLDSITVIAVSKTIVIYPLHQARAWMVKAIAKAGRASPMILPEDLYYHIGTCFFFGKGGANKLSKETEQHIEGQGFAFLSGTLFH